MTWWLVIAQGCFGSSRFQPCMLVAPRSLPRPPDGDVYLESFGSAASLCYRRSKGGGRFGCFGSSQFPTMYASCTKVAAEAAGRGSLSRTGVTIVE
jgi:hypothetical protein